MKYTLILGLFILNFACQGVGFTPQEVGLFLTHSRPQKLNHLKNTTPKPSRQGKSQEPEEKNSFDELRKKHPALSQSLLPKSHIEPQVPESPNMKFPLPPSLGPNPHLNVNSPVDNFILFRSEDGTYFQEQSTFRKLNSDHEVRVVNGVFSWIAPEGHIVTVNYNADKNGYHPKIEMVL